MNLGGHARSRRNDPNRGRRPGPGWSSGSWASSPDWDGADRRCLRDAASADRRPAGNPGHAAEHRVVRHPFPGRPRMGCCRDVGCRDGVPWNPGWARNHPGGVPAERRDGVWSRPRPWTRAWSPRDVGWLQDVRLFRDVGHRRDAGPRAWVPLPDGTPRVWGPDGRGKVWVPDVPARTGWGERPGWVPRGLPSVSSLRSRKKSCSCWPRDAAQVWPRRVWGRGSRVWVRTLHAPCAPPALRGLTRRWKRTRPFP